MLAIRMQRTGRRGHAQFRLIAQDRRFSPASGRVVAYLGSYNPHSKTAILNKEKVADYLKNGAQPSERVVRLLQKEGIELPQWIKTPTATKQRATRHPQKLRKNQPAATEPAGDKPEPAEASEAPPAETEAAAPKASPTEPEQATVEDSKDKELPKEAPEGAQKEDVGRPAEIIVAEEPTEVASEESPIEPSPEVAETEQVEAAASEEKVKPEGKDSKTSQENKSA